MNETNSKILDIRNSNRDYIVEAVRHIIESTNLRAQHEKEIARNARKYRSVIDKVTLQRRKEIEKDRKKQEKLADSTRKRNINQTIMTLRKNSGNQSDLFEIILSYRNKVKPDVYQLCQYISSQIDRLKTKQKEGTRLVSKNWIVIPKVLNNPIIKNNQDPKILKTIAKVYRLYSPTINTKMDPNQNGILNFKAINNMLFNALRDLVLELLRSELIGS